MLTHLPGQPPLIVLIVAVPEIAKVGLTGAVIVAADAMISVGLSSTPTLSEITAFVGCIDGV